MWRILSKITKVWKMNVRDNFCFYSLQLKFREICSQCCLLLTDRLTSADLILHMLWYEVSILHTSNVMKADTPQRIKNCNVEYI